MRMAAHTHHAPADHVMGHGGSDCTPTVYTPTTKCTHVSAQIMGSRPDFLAIATEHLAGPAKRASRVDLNCGCPANTVTGNGAGSR